MDQSDTRACSCSPCIGEACQCGCQEAAANAIQAVVACPRSCECGCTSAGAACACATQAPRE